MAEVILKSLLEDQISIQSIIEWLSSDVEDFKLIEKNKASCPKGEFVIYVLSHLRQSFLSAHQPTSTSPIKQVIRQNCKSKENSNKKPNPIKSSSLKPSKTPTNKQDATDLRKDERANIYSPFSPQETSVNHLEVHSSPFKSTELPLQRTPMRVPLSNDPLCITPNQKKHRSVERELRHSNCDTVLSSPSDSRSKNTNRSLTLADFMKESPNQRKRFSNGPPKGDKIATSTPSRDSEWIEPANSPSPGWRNKKQQRRIKPTKVLCFDEESSPKNGFVREEAFGVIARPQVISTFEAQADVKVSEGLLSFAEERSLLKDERLKVQNLPNQRTPTKLSNLSNSPVTPPVVKEVADPAKVTFKERLLVLCDLYSNMIDANFVSNLTTELHFVLSLLVVQKSCPMKKDESQRPDGMVRLSMQFNELSIKSVPAEKTELETSINSSTDSRTDVDFGKRKDGLDDSTGENDVMNNYGGENVDDDDQKKYHRENRSFTDVLKTVSPNQSDCTSPLSVSREEVLRDLKTGTSEDDAMHLDTVHNCVFFATNVLWRQKQLLANLDRITLKLLLDNERVATFMPELALAIEDMYNKASPRTTVGQNLTATSAVLNFSTSENVAFHSERDNSTNFESSNAFRCFRKQRDAFYDIFRIWDAEHLNPTWNFHAALKPRIRALLDMCRDSTNYMHLARLFRMQLVAAVMGGKKSSDDLDNSFLECLRAVDPEKLKRLRERLVTPFTTDDPRPSPHFPGQQEFFREFIMAVDNVSFVEHLKDNLISHLLELDQTDFCASDVEESDLVVDEETRLAFVTCVTTTQLLAKFLGFIVFLPYQKSDEVSRNIIESELAIRCKVTPPLNVMACVTAAWGNRRLVVTLPWVVQYLGMMDAGAVELLVYRNTLVLLLQLYTGLARGIGKSYPTAPEDMAPKTVILLRFLLGWLFELPCLPDGFLFVWKRAWSEQECIQGTPDNSMIVKRTAPRENSSWLNWNCSLGGAPPTPADSLDLVDTAVLYAVCPYLLGLRFLLSAVQEANANNTGSVRHITPVSTTAMQHAEPVSSEKLELQLEENFFHGLPESVQKTVEFVVERVTSACIKQICNTLIPNLKERGMTEFKAAIAEELKNKSTNASQKLITRRDLVVKQVMAEMRVRCNEDVEKICNQRCESALTALISQVSLPPSVCEMCVSISTRLSSERVVAWFRTHATFKTYAGELQDELKKALAAKDPSKEAAVPPEKTSHLAVNPDRQHDDTAPAPADTLAQLRGLICEVLEMHGEGVTGEAVANIIKDVEQLIKYRVDVTPAAERTFSALLLDLTVALVCHCPEIVTEDFIKNVTILWKNDALLPTDNALSRIICSRNLLFLAQSSHPAAVVWGRLAQLVGATLCEELVTADDVELQCLTILHQTWPQAVLVNFSTCVSEIVRIYRKKTTNVDSEKFVYLLNWLSEITKYMEDYPDGVSE